MERPTAWEYLTLKLDHRFWDQSGAGELLNQKLNELGADGWEVTVATDPARGAKHTEEVVLILKRPTR